jgi:hypothetical protein
MPSGPPWERWRTSGGTRGNVPVLLLMDHEPPVPSSTFSTVFLCLPRKLRGSADALPLIMRAPLLISRLFWSYQADVISRSSRRKFSFNANTSCSFTSQTGVSGRGAGEIKGGGVGITARENGLLGVDGGRDCNEEISADCFWTCS